jgi:hypothetical protein
MVREACVGNITSAADYIAGKVTGIPSRRSCQKKNDVRALDSSRHGGSVRNVGSNVFQTVMAF